MEITQLKTGSNHYMAYVGPATQYDFMGATQFRLLCTLGLRANHYLLDFGCGSLRAGRLFIAYLDESRYFGIEPNKWLVDDAINNQVGNDLIRLKKPRFDYNSDFSTDVFSQQFDFIVAQSIFSHTGVALVRIALRNFRNRLKSNGLIAATFINGNSDFEGDAWVYPGCIHYRHSTIIRFAEEAGLSVVRIPWYHPRQTWYLFSKDRSRLPCRSMLTYLSGAVLFDSEFVESWKVSRKLIHSAKKYVSRILPKPIRKGIKKFFGT